MTTLNPHLRPAPVRSAFWTRGTKVLLAIAAIGVAAYTYRLWAGLGAATNLSNQYPWGLWIAIDVATGVALAAGGFTTAALADIFHQKRYHAIVRPALLTALLGYTFVVIGLMADLGRYYNIWHPMLPSMWHGDSVLFEVGICVILYLTVLYIEFLPVAIERFRGRVRLPGWLSRANHVVESCLTIAGDTLRYVASAFIIAGVVLSCLHQSSLGTLMVIAPTKVHPLWYTPVLPVLFLLSAIAVGFPMVVFESLLASHSFRLRPEMNILSGLARYTPIALAVYLLVKIVDITIREAWGMVAQLSFHSIMWLIEVVIGVALPMVLLLRSDVRTRRWPLFAAMAMVIFGVALNRINVFLIAYQPPFAAAAYVPTLIEIAVTSGLIAVLVLVYRAMVMYFPVITAPAGRRVQVAAVTPPSMIRAVGSGYEHTTRSAS
jgi:Ni/Fe-hydrogenase subunit HybB-like protein